VPALNPGFDTAPEFNKLPVMTARARVHGRDESEAGGVGEGVGGPGERDDPVFQGLGERVKSVAAELG
jgi:hypothetical protein